MLRVLKSIIFSSVNLESFLLHVVLIVQEQSSLVYTMSNPTLTLASVTQSLSLRLIIGGGSWPLPLYKKYSTLGKSGKPRLYFIGSYCWWLPYIEVVTSHNKPQCKIKVQKTVGYQKDIHICMRVYVYTKHRHRHITLPFLELNSNLVQLTTNATRLQTQVE